MVPEDGNRIFRCGSPVRIGGWSESRLTNRTAVDEQPCAFAQPKIVAACNLHEQIVRMLSINKRQSIRGFARLKEFRIPAVGDSSRFQAKHGTERQRVAAEITRKHRHQPINREQFVRPARPCLLRIKYEPIRMKHQSPIPQRRMKHRSGLGSRLRFNACSGREKSNGVLHRRHARHGRLRAERIGFTKETNHGQTQAEETKIISRHETPHSCSRRCTQRKGDVASPVVRSLGILE